MAHSQAVPSTEDNVGNFPATPPSRVYAAQDRPTVTLPPITSLGCLPPSPEIPWSQSQHSPPTVSHYSPSPSPIPIRYRVEFEKENGYPARAGYMVQRAKKGLPHLASNFHHYGILFNLKEYTFLQLKYRPPCTCIPQHAHTYLQPKHRQLVAGAKSGQRNRRAGGASDTEIMKLSEKDMDLASLKAAKPRLKSKRVSKTAPAGDLAGLWGQRWLCWAGPIVICAEIEDRHLYRDEERWPRFKLNKHSVYVKIANEVLSHDETDGAVSVEVIRNYWINNAWAKYKAVKEREKHTGGGDGDDATQSAVAISAGNKRKKTEAGFSAQVLEEFQNSDIFKIIDAVAYADVDVVREEDVNSRSNVSDSEIEDVIPRKRPKRSPSNESISGHHRLLSEAVDAIKQKARHTEAIAQQNLELAQRLS
ncbi:hypothetical protein BDQ17DRAFT_1549157 [Cyathus striatus]|nr:hypothetical protein BDQ17DRAFT_1549157 [Cyathus striatus]